MLPTKRTVTKRQAHGMFGEQRVVEDCPCPRCKRPGTLVRLPPNFKCADVICDFCGYLAQVKTKYVSTIDTVPKTMFGAAWGPQKERMAAGIYFPLFLVLVAGPKDYSIFYLSADLQQRSMFKPMRPLSPTAKRAGWKGFTFDLDPVRDRLARIR